jgi:DNA-binding beta-propeller fold protein YncE
MDLILATVKENVSLTALDADTGDIVAAVTVGEIGTKKPHEVTLSSDRTMAFVSLYGSADYGPKNEPDNRIAVVDLQSMTLAGHIDLDLYRGPHALVTDREGKIWVTVDPNRCVLVIDADSWEIEQTIWLETPGHFSALSPDGSRIYFAAKEYPVITEVDVLTREITARIKLPVGAQALRVSSDGSRLYVGDFNRPLLHVIDCGVRELIQTVPLTGVPGWPFNSADGKYVVVTTYDEPADRGYFEILDADNPLLRRVVDLPAEPFHALVTRDGAGMFVALANGEVPRIDLATAAIVEGGFHVGGSMPEALAYINC